MKTRNHFVVVVVLFVLVVGLVALATVSKGDDQSVSFLKEAFPTGKITDRHAFLVGVVFAKTEITTMQINAPLTSARERKDILGGLEGVQVVVEDVDPEAEKNGLTRQLLQTDTELRLRQNGIRVFTPADAEQRFAHDIVEQEKKSRETFLAKCRPLIESLAGRDSDEHFLEVLREVIRPEQHASARPPYLFINVNTVVSEERGLATFSIDVQLQESASVQRNGEVSLAAIWKTGGLAACSSSRLKERAREYLRDKVDEFINAYLAANPKDRSSDRKH